MPHVVCTVARRCVSKEARGSSGYVYRLERAGFVGSVRLAPHTTSQDYNGGERPLVPAS